MQHLLTADDLTRPLWNNLYRTFEDILAHPELYRQALAGRVMASLFFEPSTRTRLSFEAAMQRLGGGVIGVSSAGSTSSAKGETLADTAVMVSGYADSVVIRHPLEGAAAAFALYSSCPVINAGDGARFHPTQTLTDLVTIQRRKGGTETLTVGLCGDLKYGRTIHSLIPALGRIRTVNFVLISPPELALPDEHRPSGVQFEETNALADVIDRLDILYMTRVQLERFPVAPANPEELLRRTTLTPELLCAAKPDMMVLHPLPRVDEIHPACDKDARALYFEQAEMGMKIRMALLLEAARTQRLTPSAPVADGSHGCGRVQCVTCPVETHDHKLGQPTLPRFGAERVCHYCGKETTGS